MGSVLNCLQNCISLTSAIESSCKGLKGLFIGLDAERQRKELVGNFIHDSLAEYARSMTLQRKNKRLW